jgi:hypothetical protein
MEKYTVKLVIFNGEDFGYWKNLTRNYLLSQGRTIWEIVQEVYVILDTLDHAIKVSCKSMKITIKPLISLLLLQEEMCMIG